MMKLEFSDKSQDAIVFSDKAWEELEEHRYRIRRFVGCDRAPSATKTLMALIQLGSRVLHLAEVIDTRKASIVVADGSIKYGVKFAEDNKKVLSIIRETVA